MFKQRRKDNFNKRLNFCEGVKHIFPKNKGKCLCKNYYKDNGRIFRSKGNGKAFGFAPRVVANTAEFHYKSKTQTKRSAKRALKKMLGR